MGPRELSTGSDESLTGDDEGLSVEEVLRYFSRILSPNSPRETVPPSRAAMGITHWRNAIALALARAVNFSEVRADVPEVGRLHHKLLSDRPYDQHARTGEEELAMLRSDLCYIVELI